MRRYLAALAALALTACATEDGNDTPRPAASETTLTLPRAVTTTLPATTQPPTTAASATPRATTPPATTVSVYYANCTAARSAGAAPIRRGEPGYRSALDRDGDGIACDT